jgi:NtrC-family two-component system sensor histidine kinase KinB
MKISIRTRFTLGMLFFFIIIAVISILSAYYMNRLSKKTDALLKENHLSVIFARDMAEELTILNQEITRSFLTDDPTDSSLIAKTSGAFNKTLQLEKNNITEAGEDKLVSGIESGFNEYVHNMSGLNKISVSKEKIGALQIQFHNLYEQTMLLSQMNEQAIVLKADDVKKTSEKGFLLVTTWASVCFLIALSFTFNFAAYYNERFKTLYNGIKEIGSGHYNHKISFVGKDEFYDISEVFNDMATKLNEIKQNSVADLKEDRTREITLNQVQDLKRIFEQMHDIEKRAVDLMSKLENKL